LSTAPLGATSSARAGAASAMASAMTAQMAVPVDPSRFIFDPIAS
jgi:hypothetical protein